MSSQDTQIAQAQAVLLDESLIQDLRVFEDPVGVDCTPVRTEELLLAMKRLRVRLRDVCHASGVHERPTFRQLAAHEAMTHPIRLSVDRLLQTHSMVYGCLARLCVASSFDLTGIGLLATRWFEHPFPLHLGEVSADEWDAYLLGYRDYLTATINDEALPFLSGEACQPSPAPDQGTRGRKPKRVTEDNATADCLLEWLDDECTPLQLIAFAGQIPDQVVFRQLTHRGILTRPVRRTAYRLLEFTSLEREVVWEAILDGDAGDDLAVNVAPWCPGHDRPLGNIGAQTWKEEVERIVGGFVIDYKHTEDPRDPTMDDPTHGMLACDPPTLGNVNAECHECDRFRQHLSTTAGLGDSGCNHTHLRGGDAAA
ncbi:MAG: hypothetical protein ACYC63_16675 [Armatimonadota bacterium]